LRVLLTGANGQLGWELQRSRPAHIELHAHDADTLDITDAQAVHDAVQALKPDWIINAAAYTAVDKAESEPTLAYAVNRDGARHLAEAARVVNARMVQVSTDFIFDGEQGHPYPPVPPVGANLFAHAPDTNADVRINSHLQRAVGEHNRPNPLSVYGASKLAGEQAVHEALGENALILRTAWVYSSHGHNFVKTMLRLMGEREQLGIVADQVGSPTWAHGLAQVIWQATAIKLHGIHHWTDAGVASWYDFAQAIHDEARTLGLLTRDCALRPIATTDYPTPARRPGFSLLDKTSAWQALGTTNPVHWRAQLRAMLNELKQTS
jgi:dTDP-4-dehydrorhamnose reductase